MGWELLPSSLRVDDRDVEVEVAPVQRDPSLSRPEPSGLMRTHL